MVTVAEVGGRIETPRAVRVYAKTASMDLQPSQAQAQHHSGSGSPDGMVVGASGFGSPTSGAVSSSSYHHQMRPPSPPPPPPAPIAPGGYHHHMHGPSPHHHHHQQHQSQIDVHGAGFMSTNPSVQVYIYVRIKPGFGPKFGR